MGKQAGPTVNLTIDFVWVTSELKEIQTKLKRFDYYYVGQINLP